MLIINTKKKKRKKLLYRLQECQTRKIQNKSQSKWEKLYTEKFEFEKYRKLTIYFLGIF